MESSKLSSGKEGNGVTPSIFIFGTGSESFFLSCFRTNV
jgi:hypothetical protein